MRRHSLILVGLLLAASAVPQSATIEHPRSYLFGIKISFLALPRKTETFTLLAEPRSFGPLRIGVVDGTVLVWEKSGDIVISSRQVPFATKLNGYLIRVTP